MEIAVTFLFLASAAEFALIAALARQIGQLQSRLPPRGALVSHLGPEIGSLPEPLTVGSGDLEIMVGGKASMRRLLLFIQPSCEVCARVAPAAMAVSASQRDLDIVLLSLSQDPDLNSEFARRAGLSRHQIFDGSRLGVQWRITTTPHAVVLDTNGTVVSKGLVNNREQVEGLLETRLPAKPLTAAPTTPIEVVGGD